ncbi:unnamed protein product [Boreogadus saida]
MKDRMLELRHRVEDGSPERDAGSPWAEPAVAFCGGRRRRRRRRCGNGCMSARQLHRSFANTASERQIQCPPPLAVARCLPSSEPFIRHGAVGRVGPV